MSDLAIQTLYSRSGGVLTRSLFCKDTLQKLSGSEVFEKVLFLFDSRESLYSHVKFLKYILEKPVSEITTVSDALAYMDSKTGLFAGTTGMFDRSLRYDYLKKISTYTIRRGDVISSRALIERLIELDFEHSPHLSRDFTYHMHGSELKIREKGNLVQLSYFDDEIDDILVGEPPVRTDEVILYRKTTPDLPEQAQEMQKIDGDLVWTFDLDFSPHRDALRSYFRNWIGFESSGASLDVSPISFESLEDL